MGLASQWIRSKVLLKGTASEPALSEVALVSQMMLKPAAALAAEVLFLKLTDYQIFPAKTLSSPLKAFSTSQIQAHTEQNPLQSSLSVRPPRQK
jgi:hypothetical protein